MERKKIGTQYLRSGYGVQKFTKACIYLINGKAYARDAGNKGGYKPLEGELKGYVRVNNDCPKKPIEEALFIQTDDHGWPHLDFECLG